MRMRGPEMAADERGCRWIGALELERSWCPMALRDFAEATACPGQTPPCRPERAARRHACFRGPKAHLTLATTQASSSGRAAGVRRSARCFVQCASFCNGATGTPALTGSRSQDPVSVEPASASGSSDREPASSFMYTFPRCFSTVFRVTKRAWAISGLLRPSAAI